MPWVYLLECSDGSLYVGSTHDLDQRLADHQTGCDGSFTSTRRPVRLLWQLETERVVDAYVIEHQIKGWRRAKKLALVENRISDLPGLARAARR
jgi:putative endonuclease